jgi:hypothetical protein
MGIIYANEPFQPGERPIYEIAFVPGKSIAQGDSLSGSPTATGVRVSDGSDATEKIVPGSVLRVANSIFFQLQDGVDGEAYKFTFLYATTGGESNMQEDFFIRCRQL